MQSKTSFIQNEVPKEISKMNNSIDRLWSDHLVAKKVNSRF